MWQPMFITKIIKKGMNKCFLQEMLIIGHKNRWLHFCDVLDFGGTLTFYLVKIKANRFDKAPYYVA